jgi:hypothetical protein
VGARVEIYGMVYPMERGHGPIHTSWSGRTEHGTIKWEEAMWSRWQLQCTLTDKLNFYIYNRSTKCWRQFLQGCYVVILHSTNILLKQKLHFFHDLLCYIILGP